MARSRSLPADEVQRLGVGQKRVHAAAARHPDKIQLWALGKGRSRQYREAASQCGPAFEGISTVA